MSVVNLETSLKALEFHFASQEIQNLEIYLDLLSKWQERINLVSEKSKPQIIERHLANSLEMIPFIPSHCQSMIDLGSGAGFPGLVVAILTQLKVSLVESNGKKCAFLREAARLTHTKCTIHQERIEILKEIKADLVTSRALANLKKLIEYAKPFTHERTCYMFHKGQEADKEIAEALDSWAFSYEKISLKTGVLLLISDIHQK